MNSEGFAIWYPWSATIDTALKLSQLVAAHHMRTCGTTDVVGRDGFGMITNSVRIARVHPRYGTPLREIQNVVLNEFEAPAVDADV